MGLLIVLLMEFTAKLKVPISTGERYVTTLVTAANESRIVTF